MLGHCRDGQWPCRHHRPRAGPERRQIAFKVTAEKSDAEEKVLQHREYQASQGEREWLLLVSTVKDPQGGQAMLTANRY